MQRELCRCSRSAPSNLGRLPMLPDTYHEPQPRLTLATGCPGGSEGGQRLPLAGALGGHRPRDEGAVARLLGAAEQPKPRGEKRHLIGSQDRRHGFGPLQSRLRTRYTLDERRGTARGATISSVCLH